MKYFISLLFCHFPLIASAQLVNSHALTSSGGNQGQIGEHYFEYSLGDLFTATGQTGSMYNTTGIIQPVMGPAALPVTLISFEAAKEGQSVELQWATSLEINSDRFDIERSTTGKDWIRLGSVKAKNREGNNTITHYTFSDYEPSGGTNLYRLKIIDHDASFTYSKIRTVGIEIELSVYPNPASDKLFNRSGNWNQVKSVSMVNLSGRTVYYSAGPVSRELSLTHLPTGNYTVQITGTGWEIRRKVAVAR
ncbi:T9SS type A sorting domain-containing protein [Dyadobacter crusticola]|uniref:T9SS type A sorting domain-containing protein n=1 Tax=Dyadobacter crusticola TaxID=292407 RepID=UPI00068B7A5E|nr:T9SS type A sorting domain-containing protein [Dyadobacter crusticola]